MSSTNSSQDLGARADNWGIPVTVCVIAFFDLVALALHEHTPIYAVLSRCCCPCLRWNHWPVSFISNKRDDLPPDTRPRTFWAFDVLDPLHLVTSFCLPTWALIILHVVCFLYFVAFVLLDVLLYYPKPGSVENPYWQWLTFLTNWSIMFYALASFVAALNTIRYWRKERKLRRSLATHQGAVTSPATPAYPGSPYPAARHGPMGAPAPAGPYQGTMGSPTTPPYQAAYPMRQGQVGSAATTPLPSSYPASEVGDVRAVVDIPPGHHPRVLPVMRWDFLSVAHLLLMEVFTTASFFVAVWYWVGVVGIAQSEAYWTWATTYMPHGGSALLAAFQIMLTRLPIVSHHYPALVLYANLYLVLLWVYGSVTGVWRYGLDWHYVRAVGAYIVLMPILFLMFSLWFFLAKLRYSCCIGRRLHKVQEQQLPVRY